MGGGVVVVLRGWSIASIGCLWVPSIRRIVHSTFVVAIVVALSPALYPVCGCFCEVFGGYVVEVFVVVDVSVWYVDEW